MSRTSDFLRVETQEDGASAISTIKKVCRNILAVTVMSTMVVATFPAGAVFAAESDDESVIEACDESREVDIDEGEELRIDGVYDAEGEMICSIAIEDEGDEGDEVAPDCMFRSVPISEESSTAHWWNDLNMTDKITTLSHGDSLDPIEIADENGMPVMATVTREDDSNGQDYRYLVSVNGETVITIEYIGNKGEVITVNVLKDLGFTLRWQTKNADNESVYEYCTFSEAGEYVISKSNNLTDMWLGFEKPVAPRVFECTDLIPNKRGIFRSGDVVTFTVVTTADELDDVEIDYAANGKIVSKTFDYAIDEIPTSDVRIADGKITVTIEVIMSFKDNASRNGQITYGDCSYEIELEASSGEVFCDLPGFEGLQIPADDPRCVEVPQTGVFFGSTAAAEAVEYAAYNNDLLMMGAVAAGSAIAAGASKKSRKENK